MMGLNRSLRLRAWCGVFAALAVGLALVASSAAAPPTVKQKEKQKEAQARSILAQVQALDVSSGAAVEAWDGAKYELKQLKAQEAHNKVLLRWARHGYRIAEQRAEARLVALFESDDPSAIDAIFGATNLNDMMNRIETIHATTALDRRLVEQVQTKRAAYESRAQTLATERARQAQTVLQLNQRRQQIEAALAKRQRLLASVQGEVQQLKVQEAAQQARLVAEARKRLAAEQAAAKAAAQARANAAAAAAAAAAARAKEKAKTTATPTTTATTPTTTSPTTTTTPSTTDPTTSTTTSTTSTDPTDQPPTRGLVTAPAHPQAATIAMQYLGIPYLWGGASPTTGFDCSGLVMYVYAQLGIVLPHFAAAQFGFGVPVPRDQLQPGDLVFFDNLNHVGISLGGNEFVDAPHTGDVVKIGTITGWYEQNYVGARRI
jgi:cell wall-associated NlpC family hydrolase